MTYLEELTAIGTKADTEVAAVRASMNAAQAIAATLQTQLDGANAKNATLQTQLDAANAKIATLQAQIDALTKPPAPAAGSIDALPAGWTKKVFADDFSGTAVDTTKWNVRNNTTQNNMDGRNFAANCVVKDSVLSIKTGLTGDAAKPWSCGYLDTIGKSSFRNGRWEARMRFPWGATATGFWPAFWLRPDDGGNGELDGMEAWPAKNELGVTIHHDYLSDATHVKQNAYRLPLPLTIDPTQWHTYSIEKEPGSLKFYIDNKLVSDMTNVSWRVSTLERAVNWNIRLNLQMGGSWGGKPNAQTDLTKTFDIDWVRVLAR